MELGISDMCWTAFSPNLTIQTHFFAVESPRATEYFFAATATRRLPLCLSE